MAHPEQFVVGLFVITVPDEMPQATDPPFDDFQSRAVPRFEGINPAQRLLDVLNPHGDMPPIQNTADRLANGSADQTR